MLLGLLVLFPFVLMIAVIGMDPILGLAPFGPTKTITCTVLNKHVDVSKSGKETRTNYMVSTDQGTFEVDNSFWLWLWNADEIYGRLEINKVYTLTVKGNKRVGFLFQSYPFIIKVEPVQ